MPRVTAGFTRKRRHKRLLKRAKGFVGGRGVLYKSAHETLLRAGAYRQVGRRIKKRDYRGLWIIRLSAAARARGLRYGQLIDGLIKSGITLNRKSLSEIAIADPAAFDQIAAKAKAALNLPVA
ncbi:MAG: 50S ribosomal protein L20 [Phycisphaerae bacterium]|jgi:large subunit ribosomal protein L20